MKRPSAVVLVVIAGIAALLGLLAYGVASQSADDTIRDAIARGDREPAPDISLPPLGGGPERSLDEWHGQVVVLNYWASWCEPCREEAPLLERWHRRMADRGGLVLGVDVLDVTSDAEAFIEEYGLTYPQLRDRNGSTQSEFGIIAYPETFVLDRGGRIAAARRGPVDQEFMEEKVAPLLDEEA